MGGQDKCRSLFTALCQVVNDPNIVCEKITIKYFEPGGHTFMAANSFHHEIEDEMRRKRNLYNFKDFENIISSRRVAVEMQIEDF